MLGLQPVDYPLITLRGYIIFWGCAFTLITLAIALWKQESDHYTEAQERKRQRRRKHKHKHTNGSGSKVAKLEAGTAGAGDEAVCSAVGSEEEGDLGLDWSHRKAEIVSAYARLWEVVSVQPSQEGVDGYSVCCFVESLLCCKCTPLIVLRYRCNIH